VKRVLFVFVLLSLVGLAGHPIALGAGGQQVAPTAGRSEAESHQLRTTDHPALSRDAAALWFVPSEKERNRQPASHAALADAAEKYAAGDFKTALTLATRASTGGMLQEYASLYVGQSQLALGQAADARRTLDTLREDAHGYVVVAASLASGEAAEALSDYAAAISIYEELSDNKAAVNDGVLSRLGRAALAAADRKKAEDAFTRVYYEFPLSENAAIAAEQLVTLQDQGSGTNYKLDLARASILFGARRYTDARTAYQAIVGRTSGEDREVADLRIAECDYFLGRYDAAREALKPYLDEASRKAEARFFYLSAFRELGQHEQYVTLTRALVSDFPDSSWAEEALNNLGTHYILNNEDELASQVFTELYQKFPKGPRAERAAWKAGWWSYKNADYANTVSVFESAAGAFPRSDYRPSFLYWAARSHAKLGHGDDAAARLRLVHADYANSYYGRLAAQHLARRGESTGIDRPVSVSRQPVSTSAPRPPTESRIRALLAAGLYDDALNELRYAQRAWGGSPELDATIAWAYNQKGDLRRGITLMRRVYPQFLTAGGQELPAEILQVIFPLTYWNSIRKHSIARGLDPYVIAALIAQESTFDPDARSSANAWGLMQIVPSTGRRLARSLKIRRFTTATLTNPDINIRMGTLHFSQLVRQYGGTHYALASYNAGESRVLRWKAERPGLDEDEFIDDIPFPETQNYVKRILGTAEDYRRLYGEGGGKPIPVAGEITTPARTSAPARKTSGRNR
jgi:peptidoglycan lytic transglycosylase